MTTSVDWWSVTSVRGAGIGWWWIAEVKGKRVGHGWTWSEERAERAADRAVDKHRNRQ